MSTEKQFNLETIEVSMLPELQGWKEKQEAIVLENPFINIVDNKTYEEAKKARTTLVSARTTIEKQDKLIASKLKDVRTKAGDFSSKLVQITLPHEEKQQDEVRRYEALKEAERLAKEKADQERKDALQLRIELIYQKEKSKVDTLTFENIVAIGLDLELNLFQNDEDFEEFDLQFASKIQLLKQQLEDKIQVLTDKENQRIEAEKLAKEKADFEAEKLAKSRYDKEIEDKRIADQKVIDNENNRKAKELETKEKENAKKLAKEKADFEANQKQVNDANAKRQEELDAKEKAIADAERKKQALLEQKEIAEIEVIETPIFEMVEKGFNTKKLIIDTICDLVGKFTYYDRKEDEDLSIEKLNLAVKNNEISIEEMVEVFRQNLESTFKN